MAGAEFCKTKMGECWPKKLERLLRDAPSEGIARCFCDAIAERNELRAESTRRLRLLVEVMAAVSKGLTAAGLADATWWTDVERMVTEFEERRSTEVPVGGEDA